MCLRAIIFPAPWRVRILKGTAMANLENSMSADKNKAYEGLNKIGRGLLLELYSKHKYNLKNGSLSFQVRMGRCTKPKINKPAMT